MLQLSELSVPLQRQLKIQANHLNHHKNMSAAPILGHARARMTSIAPLCGSRVTAIGVAQKKLKPTNVHGHTTNCELETT